MVYLTYVFGWNGGEPYERLISIHSTEEGAKESLETYLSKHPLDKDGEAYNAGIFPESMDAFTSDTQEKMMS